MLMNYPKRVLRAEPRSTKQKYNQHIKYHYLVFFCRNGE